MSKIPYMFTPIPTYFKEKGWFDNYKTLIFVSWAFSKCSCEPRKIFHDFKEITLEPFEFIAGRLSSSKECRLSENEFRHQLISMEKAGLLKKTPNSITNRFTCYKWVIEVFSENSNQLNNQPTTNRPPTDHHKLDIRYKKEEEQPSDLKVVNLDAQFFYDDENPKEKKSDNSQKIVNSEGNSTEVTSDNICSGLDNQELKKKKKVKSQPKLSSETATQLANYFYSSIAKNLPKAKLPPKTKQAFERQALFFDSLLKNPEYSPEEIKKTIDYAHTDPFWKPFVQTPEKLEQKIGTLLTQL